jgi:hypothetical protein
LSFNADTEAKTMMMIALTPPIPAHNSSARSAELSTVSKPAIPVSGRQYGRPRDQTPLRLFGKSL